MKKLLVFLILYNFIVFGAAGQGFNSAVNEHDLMTTFIPFIAFIIIVAGGILIYKHWQKTKPLTCSECGLTNDGVAKFCIKCGKSLNQEIQKKKIGKAIWSCILGGFACIGIIIFMSSDTDISNNPIFALLPFTIYAIIGLPLGISAWRKQKHILAKIGIILSSIGFLPLILTLLDTILSFGVKAIF